MKVINYLKERWITYTFIALAFGFSLAVYKLDNSFTISESNASYILLGWLLLFLLFVFIDYGVLTVRVKKINRYGKMNAYSEDVEAFTYPLDQVYGENMHNLAVSYEQYKADIRTQSAEELEFITKWVHDVKVPISAARLIVENDESSLLNDCYQRLDQELFSIEESIQRVFYQIKSNRFYDDYKLERIGSKKLIGNTLKAYVNFFSYKKINISITGENFEVLTDEKWSGYILSQILSNAVKHTPVKGRIDIATTKIDNKITISVKNSGKGILPRDMGQIFNKGYTASEDRNGLKATGYGLYLSKKLSDLLGHRLTVQSEYGAYAVFKITFIENESLHHVTKL